MPTPESASLAPTPESASAPTIKSASADTLTAESVISTLLSLKPVSKTFDPYASIQGWITPSGVTPAYDWERVDFDPFTADEMTQYFYREYMEAVNNGSSDEIKVLARTLGVAKCKLETWWNPNANADYEQVLALRAALEVLKKAASTTPSTTPSAA